MTSPNEEHLAIVHLARDNSSITEQLASYLGVPTRRIAMDNLQEGAGLAGSSSVYSNSEPGEVFHTL